jgi:hypothetical protein
MRLVFLADLIGVDLTGGECYLYKEELGYYLFADCLFGVFLAAERVLVGVLFDIIRGRIILVEGINNLYL